MRARLLLFGLGLAAGQNSSGLQTAQDCLPDQGLAITGDDVGYCTSGSYFNQPRDVITSSGNDHGPYLNQRYGGPGYVIDENNEVKM